jgi:hypothetical protein
MSRVLAALVRRVHPAAAMDTDTLRRITVALDDLRQELTHLEEDIGAGDRRGAVHRAHRAEVTVRLIRGTLGERPLA